MLDYIRSSISIIDVSNESAEEFTVEAGVMQTINERFRVRAPRTDVMSAFMGASATTLFPSTTLPQQPTEVIDTAGSQFERQLLNLIDEHQSNQSLSPSSFVDTEFEESPQSPDDQGLTQYVLLNSFGRPSTAIFPTSRGKARGRRMPPRPQPSYPPGNSADASNFNAVRNDMPAAQMVNTSDTSSHYQNDSTGLIFNMAPTNVFQPKNPVPLMFQFSNHAQTHRSTPNLPTLPIMQQSFAAHGIHSTNIRLQPSGERNTYILSPTVMPHIAASWYWCGNTYDRIAQKIWGSTFSQPHTRLRLRETEMCEHFPSLMCVRQNCSPSKVRDWHNPAAMDEPRCVCKRR